MSEFLFELKEEVTLQVSGESGVVRGRAEYSDDSNTYYIHYKSADGRTVSQWWSEELLSKV